MERDERLSREVLAQAPSHFDSLHRLGVLEAQRKNLAAAAELIASAIRANPGSAAAHCNLGNVLRGLKRHEDALASYERALALEPEHAEILSNRGATLHELSRYAEALDSYERALVLKPRYPEALYNRGNVLRDMKRHEDALASYDGALALEPRYAKAWFGRGNALHELDRDEEALASFERASILKPDYVEVYKNRAAVLETQGRTEEALACYDKLLELTPEDPAIHHALIFGTIRMMPDYSQVYALCRRFAAQFEGSVARLSHQNPPVPDRKLRVGYVSGDFRQHPIGYFMEPVFANHDRREVDVFCYSNHHEVDGLTRRLMYVADQWRPIAELSDDQAAALVQQDGIDILVDLSGHTGHNRLLMFARKPAPVQVAWLGVPCTSGLTSIDYRFTSLQPSHVGLIEHWYSEALVSISATCFPPSAALPSVGDLPSRRNGYVTFASFNHPNKITPAMCALWSRVLHAVPDSRLRFYCDEHCRERFERLFITHGVGPERLLWFYKTPLGQYLARHNEVDLALDPFPYNGSTTTKSALWMGVPTVTLAGPGPASCAGLTLMTGIGLEAFVARTEDEYVELAARWARDSAGLAEIRAALRERLSASAMNSPLTRTREVEAAYRQFWRKWCGA